MVVDNMCFVVPITSLSHVTPLQSLFKQLASLISNGKVVGAFRMLYGLSANFTIPFQSIVHVGVCSEVIPLGNTT